ncbi:MAG: hypothetical protein ACK4NX_01005, partial [Candidatus Paceibacteria bacterium]
ALISKMESDDNALYELFRNPDYSNPQSYKTVLGFAREISRVGEGLFLKHKKALELLEAQPPQRIIEALGYKNISELLGKEDLLEIYSALRFLEGSDWLNNVFFKQYENLTPSDFEMRQIETRVISSHWVEPAKKFMKKKHHNLSHLKELGVIFIIPWTLGHVGETMRMFSLLVHYMHEIEFYSKLFLKFSEDPETFSAKFISSLRGDVLEKRPQDENTWLIVQRYLAKDDENDWRLFWPHVNPEALHWQKAEEDLVRMGTHFKLPGLGFWHDLDWVGDYFKTGVGIDVLVSFDLVDTAMSLVGREELKKYLYHHQEALWNKIFECYFGGKEILWKMIYDNWDNHQIKLI